MKRGFGEKETLDLISLIRKNLPEGVIRTTLITGYPGETNKEFLEMMDFIRLCRFDRLGVFPYSHEEGTAAYALKNTVPEKVKQERASSLMALQQDISLELNTVRVGSVLKIVIDREEEEFNIGRSEFDSPEIDNEILIPKSNNLLEIGSFYNARIKSADIFDLYAEIEG
jgi:ribosomal protein S12 methylthiotransferase